MSNKKVDDGLSLYLKLDKNYSKAIWMHMTLVLTSQIYDCKSIEETLSIIEPHLKRVKKSRNTKN